MKKKTKQKKKQKKNTSDSELSGKQINSIRTFSWLPPIVINDNENV